MKIKKMIISVISIIVALIAIEVLVACVPKMFYSKGYTDAQQQALTIVAHRGGALRGPENTIECINNGIASGADMIEIDIHMTKDGQIVVCHDQSIDRTTTGKGLIRDLTLEQISQYFIKDAAGNVTTQKMPTLAQVLDTIAGRCGLLIEIKRTGNIYQGIEQATLDEINAHGAHDWCVIQSFNDSVLENFHTLDPTMPLEKLLFGKLPGLPVIFDVGFNGFSFEKYDYVQSFNFYYGMLPKSMVAAVHEHGKKVKMWTLEGPETTITLPVDGVITNTPDLWK